MQALAKSVTSQNTQWAVTSIGIESVPPAPTYPIEAARLLETRIDGLYAWPLQMAEKSWVDFEAFLACFLKAIDVFGDSHHLAPDPLLLLASVKRARDISAERTLLSPALANRPTPAPAN
jgi:hypothetical protein